MRRTLGIHLIITAALGVFVGVMVMICLEYHSWQFYFQLALGIVALVLNHLCGPDKTNIYFTVEMKKEEEKKT